MVREARTCSVPTCDRKHAARGFCGAHYMQHRRGEELRPVGGTTCEKRCTICGEVKPFSAFSMVSGRYRQGRCRECNRTYTKNYHAANRERHSAYDRAYRLRKRFGLSVEEYDRILESQNAGCAICGQSCSTGKGLAVDHDHETGRVRGLLCRRCNQGIGLFADDAEMLRRAGEYLATESLN